MALFLKNFFGRLTPRPQGRSAFQKAMKAAAAAWRDLPQEEQDKYRARSAEEYAQQRTTMSALGLGAACRTQPSSVRSQVEEDTPEQGIRMTMGGFAWNTGRASLLGAGSYGSVFRGWHQPSGIHVAVKLFTDPDAVDANTEHMVYRRLQEAGPGPLPFLQLLAAVGDSGRVKALVLEMAGSGNLAAYLRTHELSAGWFDDIAAQVALGLYHLHHHLSLVHLDVKPGNIMLRCSERRAYLTDFGTSEEVNAAQPKYDTYTTNLYRAPELWNHARTPSSVLTPAADIWAFGCVLYEMRMRKPLFSADADRAVLKTISQYARDRQQGGGVSGWKKSSSSMLLAAAGTVVSTLTYHCCNPYAEQRPALGANVKDWLKQWSGGGGQTPPSGST